MLSARPEEAGGMFDWDEGDRFSFEDSDRFEEDSLCSWISEPESSCNNWRGWKKQNGNNCGPYHLPHSKNKGMMKYIIFEIINLVVNKMIFFFRFTFLPTIKTHNPKIICRQTATYPYRQ